MEKSKTATTTKITLENVIYSFQEKNENFKISKNSFAKFLGGEGKKIIVILSGRSTAATASNKNDNTSLVVYDNKNNGKNLKAPPRVPSKSPPKSKPVPVVSNKRTVELLTDGRNDDEYSDDDERGDTTVKKKRRCHGSKAIKLPDGMAQCSNCFKKVNCVTAVNDLGGGLRVYYDMGWIKMHEVLQLRMPSGAVFGAQLVADAEKHKLELKTLDEPPILFDCPNKWMKYIFTYKKDELVESDIKIQEQIDLQTLCYRFLYSITLDLSFYEMAYAFLHSYCVAGEKISKSYPKTRMSREDLVKLMHVDLSFGHKELLKYAPEATRKYVESVKETNKKLRATVLLLLSEQFSSSLYNDLVSLYNYGEASDAVVNLVLSRIAEIGHNARPTLQLQHNVPHQAIRHQLTYNVNGNHDNPQQNQNNSNNNNNGNGNPFHGYDHQQHYNIENHHTDVHGIEHFSDAFLNFDTDNKQ